MNDIKVTKRKDGRYFKRISINGKMKSIYGKSSDEVRKKYIELAYSSKNLNTTNENNLIFEQWANIFLDNYKTEVTIATMRGYRQYLKNHINPVIRKYTNTKYYSA